MVIKSRSARIVKTVAAILLAGLVASACGGTSTGDEASDRESTGDALLLPPQDGGSDDPRTLLSRSLSYEGMRGVVEGVVESDPRVQEVPNEGGTALISVYAFRVVALHGSPPGFSLFEAGSTIDLVVPGGSKDGITMESPRAPNVGQGEHLLVWVADEGRTPAGQTSSGRLVVLDEANVATVDGDELEWNGSTIPLAEALRILAANPARLP